MYLVVDPRLSVSDRMLYPVVAFVPVVYNVNSFRVVGYPYPLFFININVIDVIAVHLIVAFEMCIRDSSRCVRHRCSWHSAGCGPASAPDGCGRCTDRPRSWYAWAVSYTHLDVYKRQSR